MSENFIKECLRSEAPITPEVEARLIACARAVHGIIGLMTECGELADQYKRHIFYGKPLDLTNLREELGDIDWYQCVLADSGGIEDILDCLRAVIAKLRKRFPDKFTEHGALNRNLDAERDALEQIGKAGVEVAKGVVKRVTQSVTERATSRERQYALYVGSGVFEVPGHRATHDVIYVDAVSESSALHKATVELLYPWEQSHDKEQRSRDYLKIKQNLAFVESE